MNIVRIVWHKIGVGDLENKKKRKEKGHVIWASCAYEETILQTNELTFNTKYINVKLSFLYS